MVCFFKSIDTFETIGQAIVSEYAVPLASANGGTGSVTVPGELTQDYTRQWLILGEQLLYITAVTPRDNMTTITVGDALTAFNRTIAYVEPSTYYLGEYIKELAESEYINQSDPYFDMPYLTATNSDTTEFAHVAPNNFITSLETVARNAQAKGVSIVFAFDADSVTMSISTASTTIQTVVMGDGHSELAEETYNRENISKVTVISTLGYPHYYYKTLSGEIVTEAPENRPEGEWVTVQQGSNNLLDTAEKAFAASVNSHKITFYSTLELSLFQPLLIRLSSKLYETSITYVGIQSGDSRFLYECGDAAVTLTDKVAALSRASAQMESAVPTAVSQLQNDAGYVDAGGAASAAPVQSVNGQTGTVTVDRIIASLSVGLTDLNDYQTIIDNGTARGLRLFTYGTGATNKPTGVTSYGQVIVTYAGQVSQFSVLLIANGSQDIWKRSYDGGWRAWVHLPAEDSVLPMQPATEILSVGSNPMAVGFGYAASATNVRLFIPRPNNAASASVAYSGTFYILSGTTQFSISAITAYAVTPGGICCNVTCSGLTTNAPCILRWTSGASLTINWS